MKYQIVLYSLLLLAGVFRPFRIAAQDGMPAPPEIPVEVTAPIPPAPATLPISPDATDSQLISLKFNNTPVEMVLQEYCTLTDRTLLMAPGVAANITLRSQTRLTIAESLRAIETMLAMHNIALIKEGDRFIKALPIAAARQEGMPIRSGPGLPALEDTDKLVSEIINLQHIDVGEGQSVIAGLIHGYGKIQPMERINALLITETAVNINRIRELLAQVDQPLLIREQLKIMPIQYAKASEIKAKLEEIIAQTRAGAAEERPTAARPRTAGPPGVIRAPRTEGVTPATRPAAPSDSAPGEIIVGNVKLVADDRTGLLIIITRPENIPFFEDIVAAFDMPTDPDVIIRVTRLEYAEAETVASMLNNLIGASGRETPGAPAAGARTADTGARTADLGEHLIRQAAAAATAGDEKSKVGELSAANVTILPDKRINALIIMASPADQATLSEIIRDMDMMLSQVLIEAVILEINLDKTVETGFDWVQRSLIAYETGADGQRRARVAYAGRGGGGRAAPRDATLLSSATDFAGGAGLSYYLTLFDLNLDAVLRMVATDTRTRILSSPIILTTDNREAEIDVATERYFYKGKRYVSTTTGQGVWEDDVETKRVGIKLTVTPKINVKGFVVMDVTQNIDNVAGVQRINEVDWPIIASRKLSASISVQSGETIVLGGLSMKQDDQGQSRVPFFGKIPLLGMLFRASDSKDARSEVVVFITPYVLDTPAAIEAEARRRKNVVDSDQLWKQGWSNSKLAEPLKSNPHRSPSEVRNQPETNPAVTGRRMDPVVAPPDAGLGDIQPPELILRNH